MRARIVFMGSPAAAAPALRAAAEIGDVVAVITRPDRPAGRGRKISSTPVAAAAEALGVPVHRPETMRGGEAQALPASLAPDVVLVVAYGRILPRRVLDIPPLGCVNVHFSLLPRHRGAAPVARAILAGDVETGVTLMKLDEGMDTGPILALRSVPIGPDETAGDLTERLADLGADMVRECLPRYLAGRVDPRPQPDEGATLAPPLRKEDGRIRWDRPANDVHRLVRAVNPRPGAFTFLSGVRLLVHRARLLPGVRSPGPGRLLVEGRRLAVGCADGCVELLDIQREGGRRTDAASFLAGFAVPPQAAFEEAQRA